MHSHIYSTNHSNKVTPSTAEKSTATNAFLSAEDNVCAYTHTHNAIHNKYFNLYFKTVQIAEVSYITNYIYYTLPAMSTVTLGTALVPLGAAELH